ncbi:hypothetical protein Psuf_037120 [Phytohabitans suffuscus]|uniref:IclR-ED domain-containing protein n=1 Tax=Phytohabitans suffuscus TaxID=624315 RepID=A0A6F8YK54_9ACTN|nr:hypothetical protein Psuf_037120 [Phytohabitans suffuscus]
MRTLAYEGYVIRREDGTYIVGLEVADRYRELVAAFRGPASVGESLRRAAMETGYSHYVGRFVGGRVAITASADGPARHTWRIWPPASTTARTPRRWERPSCPR